MVVGESGLGKSTLINSMFLTDIYQNSNSTKLPQTLDIQEQKVKLVENDVHLTLTVVDTPGKSSYLPFEDKWDWSNDPTFAGFANSLLWSLTPVLRLLRYFYLLINDMKSTEKAVCRDNKTHWGSLWWAKFINYIEDTIIFKRFFWHLEKHFCLIFENLFCTLLKVTNSFHFLPF